MTTDYNPLLPFLNNPAPLVFIIILQAHTIQEISIFAGSGLLEEEEVHTHQ